MLKLFALQNSSAPKNFDVTISAASSGSKVSNGSYKVQIGTFSVTTAFSSGTAQIKLPADKFTAGASISGTVVSADGDIAANIAAGTLLPLGQVTVLKYQLVPFSPVITPNYLTLDSWGQQQFEMQFSSNVAKWTLVFSYWWLHVTIRPGDSDITEGQEYDSRYMYVWAEDNNEGMRQAELDFYCEANDGRTARVRVQIEQN